MRDIVPFIRSRGMATFVKLIRPRRLRVKKRCIREHFIITVLVR